jgi:hypothetical protein
VLLADRDTAPSPLGLGRSALGDLRPRSSAARRGLVTMVLDDTPGHSAPQLAPPILEWVTADCRRTLAREVITWDLPWPVAAPHLGSTV